MPLVKKEFQGRSAHRYRDNPLEKRFAEAWQRENDTSRPGLKYALLEYLMDEKKSGTPIPLADLSSRDWEVANTLVQWLGSPVGVNFLRDVLARAPKNIRQDLVRSLAGVGDE